MQTNPQAELNYRSNDEIHSFIKTIETAYMLDRHNTRDSDRREVERMNLTMPVGIIPMHENTQELDYLHHGISRDISCKGIGLVTTDPIRLGVVLLSLEPCRGEVFYVMARITYCNGLGNYFQVGCEFLRS